jgi:DNA-binding MarR family transcriptional regulator
MSSSSSSPGPDTAAVADDLISLFTSVLKRSSAPMVEFADRYELSFTQLKLMYVLANAREPLPIGRIAELTGGSLPSTGRAVDALVRHELADRSEDPDDRRVKLVQITKLGDSAMREIFESRISALRELLGQLTRDELAHLTGALTPLLATLPGRGEA